MADVVLYLGPSFGPIGPSSKLDAAYSRSICAMLRISNTCRHILKRRRRSYFFKYKAVSNVGPYQSRPIRVESPRPALLRTRRFVPRILQVRYDSTIAYILTGFISAASIRITIVCQQARISACRKVIVFDNPTG